MSAQLQHHGAPDHHSAAGHPAASHGSSGHGAADEHHDEPGEEVLAPDESPTPLWLPVLGAVLFFVAFILIAAF